jgi:hypothetical protein
MSAEDVKPCPFCGSPPARDRLPYGLPVLQCANPNCEVSGGALTWGEWQTRPVEDALRARAEKAEAALAAALAVIDADLRQADDAALALRYDAAEADAAGDAVRAAHLSREADKRNRARITLRVLLVQINAAIAKANAKELTT